MNWRFSSILYEKDVTVFTTLKSFLERMAELEKRHLICSTQLGSCISLITKNSAEKWVVSSVEEAEKNLIVTCYCLGYRPGWECLYKIDNTCFFWRLISLLMCTRGDRGIKFRHEYARKSNFNIPTILPTWAQNNDEIEPMKADVKSNWQRGFLLRTTVKL